MIAILHRFGASVDIDEGRARGHIPRAKVRNFLRRRFFVFAMIERMIEDEGGPRLIRVGKEPATWSTN